jgi:L-serine dehydratase
VYQQQGSDLGFAAGLMGWEIDDRRFPQALELAAVHGLEITFAAQSLPGADHPNTVELQIVAQSGRSLTILATSVGGGAVVIRRVDGWPVHLTGDSYQVVVEGDGPSASAVRELLRTSSCWDDPAEQVRGARVLVCARSCLPLAPDMRGRIEAVPGVSRVWTASPLLFPQPGTPLFASAAEMVALAEGVGWSLGEIALAYEAALLGLPEAKILAEVGQRFEVMRSAVQRGLGTDLESMQLLHPSAGRVYRAEAGGELAVGGLHTRAAARAMAVMHVNSGMGVVCAAPTAGSAGTIPGVVVSLAEEVGLGGEEIAMSLLAAAAVGLVVANRATFAAEVAGCQVEIGASGAMAAAAVVEAAGGHAQQACDAAAIAFQNTMGSVCDLVQGIVEIPCHTRNAVAASSAFVCADLVMGGYANPIPLDETIDAVYAVGRMLPRELKVTALGGLALAPSARAMPRLR